MELHDVRESRRRFLNWLLGGGAVAMLGAVLYPVMKYIVPPKSGEANVSQVKLPFTLKELHDEEKRFKIFKFGRDTGIIFVTPEGDVRALAATCTHLDCLVQYRLDMGIIWCACHNGRYDLRGRNISGPPPRPLEEYEVHVDKTSGEIAIAHAAKA